MQSVECYEHIEHHDDLTGFVQQHASLINKIAWQVKGRLPSHIELDDLIQSGLIGLLEAKNSFSDEKGASFTTYASLKIRCAIYEFIRKNSGITRDISQNIKKISAAVSRLENSDEMPHSDSLVAREMGISIKKYGLMTREIMAYQSISMHEAVVIDGIAGDDTADPLYTLEADSDKSWIASTVRALPEREQLILALYYNDQLSFKEIATVTDLTEARISQLHSMILSKLRRKLTHQNKE
ncbi:MAG: sigma-70 family RNA polymerase sigma factor [Legionellales bacterium]